MTTSRREFLEGITGGAALFGAAPLIDHTSARDLVRAMTPQQEAWDLSWTKRIKGKNRAVFDVPEIENGYGVWRSMVWMQQYKEVLGASDKDLTTVLILRHNGIALALSPAFWSEYGVGKSKSAIHPITLQPTDQNPAMLAAGPDVPPPFVMALQKFIERGGIALGCAVAFGDCVELVKAKHKLDDAAAKKRAMEGLVPGVILQPSGVFAAVRAQQEGAVYVRAS